MTLELGKIFINPTARFLTPILNSFNTTFLQHFNLVRNHLLGFAIGDVKYDKAKKKNHKYLLFTAYSVNGSYDYTRKRFLNGKGGRTAFLNFLKQIRKSSYYYDDYIYDEKIHIVVYNLPEKYNKAYDEFIKGKYSKMFSEEEIKELFTHEDNIAVLKKLPQYKEIFINQVKRTFSVKVGSYNSVVPEEIIVIDENTEFELPPSKETDWI